jgi:predicted metal-binding membrane protein
MPRNDSQPAASSVAAATGQLPPRERIILWGGLLAATVTAWIALAQASSSQMSGATSAMASMSAGAVRWSLHDAWLVFAMWTVMMIAMMLPSASPMIEMYARVGRGRDAEQGARTWIFVSGYLLAWAGFSAVMTAVQYTLERADLITDAARMGSLAAGLLLIATGMFQFTPLKQACLTQCRSPLGFFMTRWRPGIKGALSMGLEHGAFCVGCCWLLMALMFVAGAMNLAWAAALTIFVLVEKVAPWRDTIVRVSGIAMIASGAALAVFG